MDILSENKKLRGRLCVLTAILGLIFSTACFVFARLEVVITSDILLMNSFSATLLSLLQSLLIVLLFALFYSFSSYLAYKIGIINALPFMFIVVGITLYRSLLSLGGKYFIDGVSSYDFAVYTLPMQALSFLLELVQYLLILFVIWLCQIRAKETDNKNTSSRKLLDFSNPTLASLFFISLTVTVLNVGSRIIYDIGYGAPTSSQELLQMVIAYASDLLLYGVILFFAMRYFVSRAEAIYQKHINH